MDARQIVGQTQGARKRAARRTVELGHTPLVARSGETPSQAARRYWRVGQRIRPCPGCPTCRACLHCGAPAYCFGSYESHSGTVPRTYACDDCCGHGCEDGHCEPVAPDEEGVPQRLCDGSGVRPAKKRGLPA